MVVEIGLFLSRIRIILWIVLQIYLAPPHSTAKWIYLILATAKVVPW